MSSTVDNIKDKLGIADVIGSYIKLEKAGINFKALCPFHHEKTASFSVSPSRGSFYCFGCGEKGDMFTFVQKFEGVDFQGALKILAERALVPITFERAESKDKKNTLHLILEESASYFENNLRENNEAIGYLKERGLTDAIIKNFRLGYALPGWRELFKHLKNKGFEESLIEDAGLIKRNTEGKESYDRFRGRIMFPIADSSGRIIGFSGRIFFAKNEPTQPTVQQDQAQAKYINSPETLLFSKSKILYGYDKAKDGIRKLGFTILVEGQMDLLMSHQAGFKNTVALSGTALTDAHVSVLERLSSRLVLALDSDEAGMKASGKSAALTLSHGMDVKVARMPAGFDPADIIKTDPEIWKKAIRNSVHIIDFYMDIIKAAKYEERKFRQEVSRQVLPYVARIKNSIDRAHFISRIAEKIGLPENAIIEEISTIIKNNLSGDIVKNESDAKEDKTTSNSQSRADMFLDRIFGLFNAEIKLKEGKIATSMIEERLKEILGEEVFLKKQKDASIASNVLFEGEQLYQQSGSGIEEEIEELLLNLKSHILKKNLDEKTRELKEKEKSGDTEEAVNLLNICHELAREIAKIDYSLKK